MGSITYGSNSVNLEGIPFDQVVETQESGRQYSINEAAEGKTNTVEGETIPDSIVDTLQKYTYLRNRHKTKGIFALQASTTDLQRGRERELEMISHSKDMKVFSGNSNTGLAKDICKLIGIQLGNSEIGHFADGEVFASIYESVRGSDVFLVQSTSRPVNDNLMELLIMIDAMKRASAGRITAVIPYFGYARQDRKTKARDPISAKLVANMLTAAGADRVLTMDLHAAQIQGFFDIPVDNLLGNPVFVDYYAKKFGEKCDDMVVVSPDVGSVARARAFAQKLHMNLAIVDKRRQKANQCEVMNVIGDVEGKDCILFDDMVDTAGSLCNAAKAVVEVGGARNVYACASHAVLSGPAVERINDSVITELAFLDTIAPIDPSLSSKIKYLTVAPMFAEAIERIYQEISVSKLWV